MNLTAHNGVPDGLLRAPFQVMTCQRRNCPRCLTMPGVFLVRRQAYSYRSTRRADADSPLTASELRDLTTARDRALAPYRASWGAWTALLGNFHRGYRLPMTLCDGEQYLAPARA